LRRIRFLCALPGDGDSAAHPRQRAGEAGRHDAREHHRRAAQQRSEPAPSRIHVIASMLHARQGMGSFEGAITALTYRPPTPPSLRPPRCEAAPMPRRRLCYSSRASSRRTLETCPASPRPATQKERPVARDVNFVVAEAAPREPRGAAALACSHDWRWDPNTRRATRSARRARDQDSNKVVPRGRETPCSL
jgi:hypothetical protein